jgi:uncharacterized coiled-coil protein SlyX
MTLDLEKKAYFLRRAMSSSANYSEIESRIAQLESHVTEQDAEIYRLSRKVDALVKVAKDQKAQLVALAEMGAGGADEMPANEKPPHY